MMATESLESLITDIAQRLTTNGKMLVTAESCTGGLIAAQITARPGSSVWFERGWVTYANAAKTEELGVCLLYTSDAADD